MVANQLKKAKGATNANCLELSSVVETKEQSLFFTINLLF
ncbi:hypothetical protein HMPREF9019_1449 [Hoylesella timonensis CRIS 5C-B1]|uniref:Uncharacterized protein n=1 Tax=Hoylesella timonensis CRIS 5C-B1 TaxID=679189 RepID=D1VZ05_9BACT|nr:hypothetical protein HMPREF9019_1449 [Hoylesella timonensis CRIS 5C-B1]